MPLLVNGTDIKDIKVDNVDMNIVNIDGVKVWERVVVPSGTFIAECSRTSPRNCYIYENNNGNKGNLVTTIAQNDWTTLAQYAPDIEIALDYVGFSWSGVGVALNFAKLKTAANDFIYGCTQFNQPLSFPMLTTMGNYTMQSFTNFNNTISFDKWVVGTQEAFITLSSASTNFITAEFRAVQNVATLSGTNTTIWFRYRDTNDTTHNYVHLRINKDSANVNVANKTWAGHTFASVTLIDEFGNAV